MPITQLSHRRISLRTHLGLDEVAERLDQFVAYDKKFTPEMIKGKKGLVVMPKGPIYKVTRKSDEVLVRAFSHRSADGSSGRIFAAHCRIVESVNGRSLAIDIPPSPGIYIVMTLWIAASLFGLIWNLVLSVREGTIRMEMAFASILIATGIAVMMVSSRNRKRTVDRFIEQIEALLKDEPPDQ